MPAITYQPVGSGRVVVIEGAGMWRWAFLPPQQARHDEVYGTLWRSLIRWLVSHVGLLPSQQMALRSDKVTFSTSEAATATLLLREAARGSRPPEVELTGEGLGQPRRVGPVPFGDDPGQYRVTFGRLAEGRYSARVVAEKIDPAACVAAFDVRGNLAERLDVKAQPGLLAAVADSTGGGLLAKADPAALAARFDQYLCPEPAAAGRAHDGVGSRLGPVGGDGFVGRGLGFVLPNSVIPPMTLILLGHT